MKTDRSTIEKCFGLDELPAFPPRYNLAPTQDGLIIRAGSRAGSRTAVVLRWGLIPVWAKESASAAFLINARSETVAVKPAFRESFRRRRCLVVADGFFEWSRRSNHKQAYYFTVTHGEPFAMAGLWDHWEPHQGDKKNTVDTFTILTTTANEILAAHHDRMPVILDSEFYDDWLNPALTDPEPLRLLLKPFSASRMLARIVSPRVNNIKFDDPECLEPPQLSGGTPLSAVGGEPSGHQGLLDLENHG